jgi:hypothetical protein
MDRIETSPTFFYNKTQVQIDKTQVKIDKTQVKMSKTQVQIDKTQVQMNKTQVQIDKTQVQMSKTQVQIDKTQVQMSKTQVQIDKTQVQIDKTQVQINKTQVQINKTQVQIDILTQHKSIFTKRTPQYFSTKFLNNNTLQAVHEWQIHREVVRVGFAKHHKSLVLGYCCVDLRETDLTNTLRKRCSIIVYKICKLIYNPQHLLLL